MTDAISRTERRKIRTRANLIAAGGQQISTVGLSGLSIQATTELADVALGTFYNHFTNKEELVDEVFEHDRQRARAALDYLQAEATDAVERTTAIVAAIVWRAVHEPGWARLAAEFWSVGRWPSRHHGEGRLFDEVLSGIEEGSFHVGNAALAVVGARDLLGGLLRRYADTQVEIDEVELMHHAVSTVLRLLGAAPDTIDRALEWATTHPLDISVFEEVA